MYVCFPLTTGLMLSVVNLCMFSYDNWANVDNNNFLHVSFDKLV